MNLLDTLFGVQRQRALGWLLLHPDDAVHVRELARITGTSAGSLHRELARLAEAGLLIRSERGNQVLSTDNRFDAAYKSIMQCAMVALWAKGYRTSTSQPGHHQTAIQTLPKTLGVSAQTVIVLDALRKQRNASDYEGDPVSGKALDSCLQEAGKLRAMLQQWLESEYPELVD